MLQVFSASWCSACTSVKKFLTDNSILFQERDIDTDQSARDLMNRLQLRSIPVVYLDDSNFVIGFNRKAILDLAKKQ